eukprot:m51a1_g9257 hypothetical protein (294) ;mRNA; f:52869-55087
MHVRMFQRARETVERDGEVVVGGYMCPSSDSYVVSKLRCDFIPLVHRSRIVATATATALEGSEDPQQHLTLLVAKKGVRDPPVFIESVVLVMPAGLYPAPMTVGFVLNKQPEVPAGKREPFRTHRVAQMVAAEEGVAVSAEALRALEWHSGSGLVYVGGPVVGAKVSRTVLFAAASDADDASALRSAATRVSGSLYYTNLRNFLRVAEANVTRPERLGPLVLWWRMLVNYSGWAPGQLDGEIARGDWDTLRLSAAELVALLAKTPRAGDLWDAARQLVRERQTGERTDRNPSL